jgi:hypothetical protein
VRELDRLTVDDFTPVVGHSFVVDDGDAAGTIELVLTEASGSAPSAAAAEGSARQRSPFQLRFRGPAEPILAQQICPLENDTVGRLEIFLVPIDRDESGTTYEAIFA